MKKTIFPCVGRITSEFGTRRDPLMPSTWREHHGVDIAAVQGSPIFSPIDAVVMAVYRHSTGGNTLILADEAGLVRIGMCHLKGSYVREGEVVKKGDRIASVGDTGRCTGSHLHLTLRTGGKWSFQYKEYIGGKWVDPSELIVLEE